MVHKIYKGISVDGEIVLRFANQVFPFPFHPGGVVAKHGTKSCFKQSLRRLPLPWSHEASRENRTSLHSLHPEALKRKVLHEIVMCSKSGQIKNFHQTYCKLAQIRSISVFCVSSFNMVTYSYIHGSKTSKKHVTSHRSHRIENLCSLRIAPRVFSSSIIFSLVVSFQLRCFFWTDGKKSIKIDAGLWISWGNRAATGVLISWISKICNILQSKNCLQSTVANRHSMGWWTPNWESHHVRPDQTATKKESSRKAARAAQLFRFHYPLSTGPWGCSWVSSGG